MQSFQIYKTLAWLNELPMDQAESVFADCCGSSAWASAMASERPFLMLEDLYEAARRIWYSLTPADHLEAYSRNEKMESPKRVDKNIQIEYVEATRLYEDKFGFIFVLCAKDKTQVEKLAICRARKGNSVETEMRIASEEQRKIIEIKLDQLLEQ